MRTEETINRKNELLKDAKTLKELINKGNFIRFVSVFTGKDYIQTSYNGDKAVVHLDWNREDIDILMNLKPLDLYIMNETVTVKLECVK